MTAYVPDINETDLKKINLSIQQLAAGRSNATGTVTLTPGSATTVVTDANFAPGSVPILVPVTSSAATEMGNGTLLLSSRANQSFTLAHANSATTDRTYVYAILG